MTLPSHVQQRHVAVDVIGRTGEKVRFRASGRADLFDDPLAALDLQVGSSLHVDVAYPDGGEACVADVIGLPGPGVVEVELRAPIELGKGRSVTIARSRIGSAR